MTKSQQMTTKGQPAEAMRGSEGAEAVPTAPDNDVILMSVGVIIDGGLCCPDDVDAEDWADFARGGLWLEALPLATSTDDEWSSEQAANILSVANALRSLLSKLGEAGPAAFDLLTTRDQAALARAANLIHSVARDHRGDSLRLLHPKQELRP